LQGLLRKATARFAERPFAMLESSAKNQEVKFQTCTPSTCTMNTRTSSLGTPAKPMPGSDEKLRSRLEGRAHPTDVSFEAQTPTFGSVSFPYVPNSRRD
jgi:hypothetical protein